MDAPIMVELPISMRLTTSAADGGWKSLNDTDFKSMLQVCLCIFVLVDRQ